VQVQAGSRGFDLGDPGRVSLDRSRVRAGRAEHSDQGPARASATCMRPESLVRTSFALASPRRLYRWAGRRTGSRRGPRPRAMIAMAFWRGLSIRFPAQENGRSAGSVSRAAASPNRSGGQRLVLRLAPTARG